MELILWRHAEAADGMPDMERPLTDKGHRQAARMAQFLHGRLPHGTRILASPALRTQQTVQALTRHYTTDPHIAPGASADALLHAAGWPDDGGCVLLVGHQPTLGSVAAELLCGGHAIFSIRKGAIWWLARRSREGDEQTTLRLVIAPDQL
ncbi:MAG TPA: phosphohistidine phosphatase SixA [Gallionellaceae bacterium]